MKPQLARVPPESRAKAQLAGVNPEGSVVAVGFITLELRKADGFGRGKDEGLLGEDREDRSMVNEETARRRSMGVFRTAWS